MAFPEPFNTSCSPGPALREKGLGLSICSLPADPGAPYTNQATFSFDSQGIDPIANGSRIPE